MEGSDDEDFPVLVRPQSSIEEPSSKEGLTLDQLLLCGSDGATWLTISFLSPFSRSLGEGELCGEARGVAPGEWLSPAGIRVLQAGQERRRVDPVHL